MAILLGCAGSIAFAQQSTGGEQPEGKPAWVLYQEGRHAFSERRLEEALRRFRAALEMNNPYPEAEAGIGMVYEAEGRAGLAVRQYRRALEQQAFFTIPEEALNVHYRLAAVYLQQGNRRGYQETLTAITATDPDFIETERSGVRAAMRRVLLNEGIDRLMLLYRNNRLETAQANMLLGEHFIGSGNYAPAIVHLIFANIQIATELIDSLSETRIGWRFTGISTLFDAVEADPDLREFAFDDYDWGRALYYLAAAAYGDAPGSAVARSIWQLISERAFAGEWQRRAAERLRNPRIEPLFQR